MFLSDSLFLERCASVNFAINLELVQIKSK